MIKIIFFILACTTCELERRYFDFDNVTYENCWDHAKVIRNQISEYREATDKTDQGYYTSDNKLVIGFRCD